MLERFESVMRRQALQVARDVRAWPGLVGTLARLQARLGGDPPRAQRRLLERVRTTTDTSRRRGRLGRRRVNAEWLREMDALDPEALHRAVRVPTLAIGGGKDLQCRPEDTERLRALSPGTVEAAILPDLTHLLRSDAAPASFVRYRALLRQPMAPEVGERIVAWLLRDRASPRVSDPP